MPKKNDCSAQKEIWLIRHGESIGNIGVATDNHETIPLSDIGHEQAKQISLTLPEPSLIILSPFLRTQQTAAPTIARFPKVPVEVWPVQEFTYLAPGTCAGTTATDRRARVDEYWLRCDPEYMDGEGAESFAMLLSRTKVVINCLEHLKNGFIVMFTHAQFIRAMMLLKGNNERDIKNLMSQFRNLPRYGNCDIVKFKKDQL